MNDPLESALRQLRGRPLPPENDKVRGDLMAAFDAAHPPAIRRLRRIRRGSAVAAAAGLLLAAAVLSRSNVEPAAPGATPPLMARIDLEHDRLLSRIESARFDPPSAELSTTPTDDAPTEVAPTDPEFENGETVVLPPPDERLLAYASNDPALYRLVAARAFEEIDREAAVTRYRQMLERKPEGPAATVARSRLDALTP